MRNHQGAGALRRAVRLAAVGPVLSAIALSLTVTGATVASSSATETSGHDAFAAATISAPTGFAATGASSTTAALTWTAPATLTGYKLAQSPGTLAGCSATPTASTTSCTATGLSPGTTYTYTLTAVYNSWSSPSVQASATTPAAISATLLASTTSTTSGQSTTVTGVNTTSGTPLLILVYRQGSSSNLSVSSVTGSAISSSNGPSQVTAQTFGANSKYAVMAWRAAGTGTAGGTVTVSFSSSNNVTTTIDVVQLSGASSSSPVSQSAVTTGSSQTATGGSLPGVSSGNGEIFFVGLAASTTMSTPGGYAALDAPASGAHGSWYGSSASSSGVSSTLGASTYWAAVEVAIQS